MVYLRVTWGNREQTTDNYCSVASGASLLLGRLWIKFEIMQLKELLLDEEDNKTKSGN